MSPSKDALRAILIKQDKREHVASKSFSFCEDTASYVVACLERVIYCRQYDICY
jgi:hypothetical protein